MMSPAWMYSLARRTIASYSACARFERNATSPALPRGEGSRPDREAARAGARATPRCAATRGVVAARELDPLSEEDVGDDLIFCATLSKTRSRVASSSTTSGSSRSSRRVAAALE